MIRRLLTIACILSLALCLAVGVLWQRSYSWYLLATYGASDGGTVVFASDMGGLYVGRYTPMKAFGSTVCFPPPRGWNTIVFQNDDATSTLEFAFGNYVDRRKPIRLIEGEESGNRVQYLVVTDWFVMALLAIGPAARARAWVRGRRRRRAGCCAVCGYDLRATPERCPECGTVIKSPRSANSPV